MLILVPPSEGKAAPDEGPPLVLQELSYPELNDRRAELLGHLIKLSGGPPTQALERLGLTAGQVGELDRNATLLTAPTARADSVYSGVLYQHLGLAALPAKARTRADTSLRIASALWGMLAPSDQIPAYRMSIGAKLGGIGGLAAWWRPALITALPREGLVVDLRSAAYGAMWRPAGVTFVSVRAFVQGSDGRRKPISHMAKATRGEVAAALLTAASMAKDPEAVADVVAATGARVELVGEQEAWTLDVIKLAGAGQQ